MGTGDEGVWAGTGRVGRERRSGDSRRVSERIFRDIKKFFVKNVDEKIKRCWARDEKM